MNRALEAGSSAFFVGQSHSSDWRSMDSAPRDGTVIEIMCTYGVAPWYDIVKWTDEYQAYMGNGELAGQYVTCKGQPSWQSVARPGHSPASESSLKWRPYEGSVSGTINYVDPTGGLQNDAAYWRGAVAQKYGLPLDHFEKEAEREVSKNPPKWWRFWK